MRETLRVPVLDEATAQQLAYHTLYFFQVLTLDRGTTSGLLVHDQNDLGIMGSLPAWVDRAHYRAHPEAVALQAAGDVVPPTVATH